MSTTERNVTELWLARRTVGLRGRKRSILTGALDVVGLRVIIAFQ